MQKWAIGVDLGGTKIEVAIVSDNGTLIEKLRIPTDTGHKPDVIINSIADCIAQLGDKHPDKNIDTIGIGVAGQINPKTGAVLYAPNLVWHDVPLQQQLSEKTNKPVSVCNDVKAAGWGEWLHGAGQNCNDLICLFIGTGIGGAIVCDGNMLDGYANTAGEIGHITLQLNGPMCHCGNEGCFESLAGGWAISRDAQQAVEDDAAAGKMILELAGGDISKINGKAVTEAARKGDKTAVAITEKLTEALAAGITSAVNLLGPKIVIMGGGVVEGMPEIVNIVAGKIKEKALKAATSAVTILPAQLHNDSGVIGAAAYALQQLKK